jgi:hypothetical protein
LNDAPFKRLNNNTSDISISTITRLNQKTKRKSICTKQLHRPHHLLLLRSISRLLHATIPISGQILTRTSPHVLITIIRMLFPLPLSRHSLISHTSSLSLSPSLRIRRIRIPDHILLRWRWAPITLLGLGLGLGGGATEREVLWCHRIVVLVAEIA